MKRVNNLYVKLISDYNLKEAIQEVCKTHRWDKHHRRNKMVVWIESDIDSRVKDLKIILEKGYEPSPASHKRIYDHSAGKWRDIYKPKIWPDQCVHHAVIQVLQPVFMRGMDHWCCGSIKGRGIHYGIKGFKKWMRDDVKGTKYCAELDIHHYYENITNDVVMNRCKQLIKDGKMLSVIECVLKAGIMIGCYFSQWFANVILQPLDHAIRENPMFKVTHYIRYMDNFTIFSSNKRKLRKVIEFISQWLEKHDLKLKNNWQIFPVSSRLPTALGYRFGRGYTLIRKKNLLKLKRKIVKFRKKYENGRIIIAKHASGIISRMGQLVHCNSYRIRNKLLNKGELKILKDIVRKEQKKWNIRLVRSIPKSMSA